MITTYTHTAILVTLNETLERAPALVEAAPALALYPYSSDPELPRPDLG